MSHAEPIRFFLTGPTYVAREVREAMTRDAIGHRGAPFKELYSGLGSRLSQLLRTSGEVYVATGSSTLVMESAVVSTVQSDVLNLTCGAFSERWHAICQSLGRQADRLDTPWGEAIDPELVREALRTKTYEAVTVVHNETSTGVINPLADIARVVREESDALILVDTVSSLGGAPVETDAWDLDVVLAGSQKALALPPGITLFTLSDRAASRAEAIAHRGFYTDLLRYRDKHTANGTITTPAIPILWALDCQLDRILAEGVESRWARHGALLRQTVDWAAEAGFEHVPAGDARSPTVSCLRPPAGVEAPALLARLADGGWTVGSGYGRWKPETIRVGHMGEVMQEDLAALFGAIEGSLS